MQLRFIYHSMMSILSTQIVGITDGEIVKAGVRLATSPQLNEHVSRKYTFEFRRYVMLTKMLRCIVIGQSPYTHESFPYEGDGTTPSVAVIAYDLAITMKATTDASTHAFKSGFLLIRRGVIFDIRASRQVLAVDNSFRV